MTEREEELLWAGTASFMCGVYAQQEIIVFPDEIEDLSAHVIASSLTLRKSFNLMGYRLPEDKDTMEEQITGWLEQYATDKGKEFFRRYWIDAGFITTEEEKHE